MVSPGKLESKGKGDSQRAEHSEAHTWRNEHSEDSDIYNDDLDEKFSDSDYTIDSGDDDQYEQNVYYGEKDDLYEQNLHHGTHIRGMPRQHRVATSYTRG